MTHNVESPRTQLPCVLTTVVAQRAYFVADVAHTARGQTRDDGITPYIRHPERCARLTYEFMLARDRPAAMLTDDLTTAVAAAYLHDVVEDTRIRYDDLLRYGIGAEVVRIVDLLTKKNAAHEPEDASYYAAIAKDPIARLVKAADRCANLEDVANAKDGAIRWLKYVDRTVSEVLPIYENEPYLASQLAIRVECAYVNLRATVLRDHLARIERLERALSTAPAAHHVAIQEGLRRARGDLAEIQKSQVQITRDAVGELSSIPEGSTT